MNAYKKRSVFSRYMMLCTVTILIPMLILSGAFLIYNHHNLQKDYQQHSDETNAKISSAFDNVIETVDRYHYSIISSPPISKFINSTTYQQTIEEQSLTSELELIFNDITNSANYIDSIYLCNHNASYIFGSNQANYYEYFLDMSWMDYVHLNNYVDKMVLRTAMRAGIPTKCISVIKNELYNETYMGSYIYNITVQKLTEHLHGITDAQIIIISDINNNIIYSNKEEYLYADFNSVFSKRHSTFESTSISEYNYKVYSCSSDSLYKEQMQAYVMLVSFLLLLIFLCSVIASFIISKQFYKAILNVIGILQQNEMDEYDKRKENEYDFIQRNISKIQTQKTSVEDELATNLALLKKSQIKILQEQISPHFISNTLNLISVLDMAQHHQETKITTSIKNLSELLSAVTATNEYIIPLKQELEYIKKYLTIQNIKYEDKFNIEINTENSTLNMPVIKFMLQPIVENSISHGILASDAEMGSIRITSKFYEGNLIIIVTNTGEVINNTKLNELNKALYENHSPQSRHIGLLNVNQRIKLVFGEVYGLRLTSAPEKGETSVIITLPSREFNM